MSDPRDTPAAVPPARGWVDRLPRPLHWLLLIGGSLLVGVPLELAHLPAGLFLGPMIAAIALGSLSIQVRVPRPVFVTAQAFIGCLMARAIPSSILAELVADWPIYLAGIAAVIVVAFGLGILLTRLQVLPGTTAIWGSAPGAATAMVLIADAFGADTRLVAFMVYLRMVMVAVAASVVSRLFAGGNIPAVARDWLPPVAALPLAQTIGIVIVGLAAARLVRVPAGALLLPMALGVILQDMAGVQIELPPLLLAGCYMVIGWSVGLRFTPDIVRHALRALPVVFGSMLVLILACAGFAALLVWLAGVDPLTAYLATSPGGADAVAIIAANSAVDVPFVMAMQVGRFVVVMLIGPPLARFIARRSGYADARVT